MLKSFRFHAYFSLMAKLNRSDKWGSSFRASPFYPSLFYKFVKKVLLKLYLKSLKHGGRLQLDEDIPYTAQMIATITRQQIGTVERALQIFLKLGLVEV